MAYKILHLILKSEMLELVCILYISIFGICILQQREILEFHAICLSLPKLGLNFQFFMEFLSFPILSTPKICQTSCFACVHVGKILV